MGLDGQISKVNIKVGKSAELIGQRGRYGRRGRRVRAPETETKAAKKRPPVPAKPPASATPQEDEAPYVVHALYDYAGRNHDELSFAAGDAVTISAVQDHGQGDEWMHGSLPDGRAGLFPANYVGQKERLRILHKKARFSLIFLNLTQSEFDLTNMIEDLRIFILKKTEYEWKEQFKGTTPEKALDEICEFILDEEEEWSWPPSMRRDAALVEKLYGKLLNLRRINGAPAFRISSHMKYHIIASDIDLGNKMVDELYLGGYIFVKFLGLGGYGLVCQFEDGNEQHNLDQQMLQDLRYAAHGQVPEPIERKDLQHSNYAIKSIYKRKARESTIKKMTNNIKFIEENITNCGNDAYFILTNQMIEINDNYY